MSYHITSTGDISPCVTTPCPLGNRPHYNSPEQAVMGRIELATAGRIYIGTQKD